MYLECIMSFLPFTHSWIKTFLLLPCCLDGQAWLAAAAALAGRQAGWCHRRLGVQAGRRPGLGRQAAAAAAAPASAGRLASAAAAWAGRPPPRSSLSPGLRPATTAAQEAGGRCRLLGLGLLHGAGPSSQAIEDDTQEIEM